MVEPELKKILSLNPKISQEILNIQKELGLDNIKQFDKFEKVCLIIGKNPSFLINLF